MIEPLGINNGYYGYGPSFGNSGPKEKESIFLEEKFESIKDEQGIFGKLWNGVKEITTLGTSASDCESMLNKYKTGEISFEEAINYLDKYDSKQENMSSLLSNITTGVVTIATLGTGSVAWNAGSMLLKAAAIGAGVKASINTVDRATNDIEGDALDAKQIAKDAISGAVTGATSAVTSNIGSGFTTIKNGALVKGNIFTSIKNGVGCGVACGAISGSSSYMTDVAFGDREFDAGELLANTATSSLVSGVVGGAVGAGMYGVSNLSCGVSGAGANHQFVQQASEKFLTMKESARSAILSTGRKICGNTVKEVINA